ncbi:hypothetical protein ABIE56_000424 [Luteibacter sp. 621]|uniref:hypothetical protein n=1 Tax=Luteibacter sp. 621 TaxID=3373916 RepID=UPI003D1F9850
MSDEPKASAIRPDIVEIILGELGRSGPIGAAFNISIETVLKAGVSAKLDEEVTSAALLGAMVSNFNWCALLGLHELEEFDECAWSQFRKGGQSVASEAGSGADYALVLKRSAEDVRVAVFQAKRGHTDSAGRSFINVHRDRLQGRGGKVIVQMRQLQRFGFALRGLAAPGIRNGDLSSCSFVHYIGYFKDSMRAVQLSRMDAAFKLETAAKPSWYIDVEVPDSAPMLSDVLRNGLVDEPAALKWWVSTDQTTVERLLPDLINIMAVSAFEKAGDGRPLTPRFERASTGLRIDRESSTRFLGRATDAVAANAPTRKLKL